MTAGFRASTEARRAIYRLIQDAGAEMSSPVADPPPLLAISAALTLRYAVSAEIREYAKAARQHGYPWRAIGEAMSLEADPVTGRTIAEAAFRQVASDVGSGPVFWWTCPSCRETVTDRGPEAGGPADQEHGHAAGCERLARAVREYDAQWKDGIEEDGDG